MKLTIQIPLLLLVMVLSNQVLALSTSVTDQCEPANKGLLFSVSKEGKIKGYLLGTLHVGVRNLPRLPCKIKSALSNADLFVQEAVVQDQDEDKIRSVFELSDGTKLYNHLPADLYRRLINYVTFLKIPQSERDAIPYKTVFGVVAYLTSNLDAKEIAPNSPLDDMLSTEVEKLHLPVGGVETVRESFIGYDTVTAEEWNVFLAAYLDLLECVKCSEQAIKSIDHLNQDAIGTDANLVASNFSELYRKQINIMPIQDKIYFSRNENMAQKISGLIEGSKIFFVSIGAVHLGGPKGVLKILEKDGFAISPIR